MNQWRRIASLCFGLSLVWLLTSCRTEAKQSEQMGRIPEIIATVPFEVGGPGTVAVNSQTGYVYILNPANHVGIFQGLEQVASIEIGRRPSAVAVDENGGWVYVVSEYGDSVAVIRETELMATLPTAGRRPLDVAIEPESGWAYVVSGYEPVEGSTVVEGNVTVIHGTEIIGRIPLGRVLAKYVVADPKTGYVYIGGISGSVIVIRQLEEIARYEVTNSINAMSVNPNTGDVYVTGADLQLHHFKGGEFISTIGVGEGNASIRNIKVHPLTGDVYLIYWGQQTEAVIIRDGVEIGRAPVGPGGLKMAIDPLTGNVYVTDFWSDIVTAINGTEVMATFEVGWYPYGVGVNPANGWVYVSNTNDHTVTILGFQE
jgi:YVTN family beta-propeller protein